MIIALVVFWYGLVPIAGALANRYKWRQFRRRFDELRLRPLLDYGLYRQLGNGTVAGGGGTFRFTGGFESVTDGRTLWIQGEDLTIPVSLSNAETWLLPAQEGEDTTEALDPGEESPERIRWDRLSTFTEGARVFVGGDLVFQNERWCFVSTKETPLMVIFYDCPDTALTSRVIKTGRSGNDYWNSLTPYSVIIGAICLILFAITFLPRPAFRLTVITALIALFTPVYPLIPPGLLCTVLYRRLAWRARILRAYRDMARLPLRYLGTDSLPDGEPYGCIPCASLAGDIREGKIPLLLPEYSKEQVNAEWYAAAALSADGTASQPRDPFATFGVLPGKPETLAIRYATMAYTIEVAAWLVLLAGIGLNIFFVRMILILL